MGTKAKGRSVSLRTWDVKRQTGVLQITEGDKIDLYSVQRIAGVAGHAFRVVKYNEQGERQGDGYDVLVDEERSACDCLGFSRFGYCRHVSALAALVVKGRI